MPVAAGPTPGAPAGTAARPLLAGLLMLALLLPGLLLGGLARLAWNLLAGTFVPDPGDAVGLLLFSAVPGLLHGLAAGALAAFLAGRLWRAAPHRAAARIAAVAVVVLGGLAGAFGALGEVFSFGVADMAAIVAGLVAGLLLGARRPVAG